MGPDSVVVTSGSLSLTGIYAEDLVYLSVIVPVIVGKVYLAVCQFQCLDDHCSRVHVIAGGVVGSVVAVLLADGYGTYYIERQVKLSVGLVVEVVVYGSDVAV